MHSPVSLQQSCGSRYTSGPSIIQVQTNTQALHNLTSKIESLEKQISTFQVSGTTVCSCNVQSTPTYAAAASVPPPKDAVASPPSRSIRKPDTREVNLILFGLSEQGSILDTKDVVDELLEFLAGKPMQIKDMFRLLGHLVRVLLLVLVQF